ncbi:MAG: hypothetical protein AAGC60_04215 [Acidobacteriota bacterium]
MSDGPISARAVPQLAEPSRLWIAYAPRTWRYRTRLYTDLAAGRLGASRRRAAAPPPVRIEPEELDDLLYLPPVDDGLQASLDEIAERLAARRTPLVMQIEPGEPAPDAATLVACDLLAVLLSGELERLTEVPPEAIALWPLVPGIGDHPGTIEEGLESLAASGVRSVQGMLLDLDAGERRRLAEGRDEDVFDALFHGGRPSERLFDRAVAAAGMTPFPRRPPIGGAPRQRSNRRIGAALALAGDLWLRLDRPVGSGQSLLRAARGAEATQHDLAALAAEGNLKVMDWLDPASRRIVEEVAGDEPSALLAELRHEYLGPGLSVAGDATASRDLEAVGEENRADEDGVGEDLDDEDLSDLEDET